MHRNSTHTLFRCTVLHAGPGIEVNVLQICKQKSTKAKTPKAAAKAYNPFDDAEDAAPISVDELMARRPGKGATPTAQGLETVDDDQPVNEHEPKLDMPQLETGMGAENG